MASEGSKYGKLSRTEGHSKWFLLRTLTEHDKTMDHPWMQMIYNQSFTVRQYAAWLARNHAVFVCFEEKATQEKLPEVYDGKLLRTGALEKDLQHLLGANWQEQAKDMVKGSPATQQYLSNLEADAGDGLKLAAHHFLQYNAVLSGGAYLGKMVSERLCLVKGAPGLAFYDFQGVKEGLEPARVQQYLKSFDKVAINEAERDAMLGVMQQVYSVTEAMMQESYDLNPVPGLSYKDAQQRGTTAEPPAPLAEQLELSLPDLHQFTGAEGGRILFSLAGELLDVTAGAEMYGPGNGYSMLAGRDVTRCLATMSLDPADLDDLAWEPDNAEEEQALRQWCEKLKAKYPVAGRLGEQSSGAAAEALDSGGLRRRAGGQAAPTAAPAAAAPAAANGASANAAAPAAGAAGEADSQKCPISGKEGVGCPMSTFIGKPKAKAKASGKAKAEPGASSGFMAGKSLLAAMDKAEESSGDWWLSRLCPLHWDTQTFKALAIVAGASWFSGICTGWFLRRLIVG